MRVNMWPFKSKNDNMVKDRETLVKLSFEFDRPINEFYDLNFKSKLDKSIRKEIANKFGDPALISFNYVDYSHLAGISKKCYIDAKIHQIYHPDDGHTDVVVGIQRIYSENEKDPELINVEMTEISDPIIKTGL